MASRNRSRHVMKENRIPLGKKKEYLEKKIESVKIDNSGSFGNKINPKEQGSRTNKKSSRVIETKIFNIDNINEMPTDTSLTKPIQKPRPKLSTIKEIKEFEDRAILSNIKTKMNLAQTTTNDDDKLKEEPTKLIRELQDGTKSVEEFNNTINDMLPNSSTTEVVLSPFVCTTRGKKWKPSPLKPPKLSERFAKYEDDNMADAYRKKLDGKTIELQNKVKRWTELSSEDDINIPQYIRDEIDVVCGQTKLLTTDKFMQMRTLIEEFDNKSGSMPINTTDLDGFWDMLLLQVEKLEGQFSQLELLKNNNWVPIEPIAKKVLLNKGLTLNKRPEVKSKFADFIKSQKSKKAASNSENLNAKKDSQNHFNKMKVSNDTFVISSTPTASHQKNPSFPPVLLKTMELSYVARRSGMSPVVFVEPHVSPLKPALKNPKQDRGIKRKTIQFKSLETNDGFVTPENSCNNNLTPKKSCVQNRIVTPHVKKAFDVVQNTIKPQNISTRATKCVQPDVKKETNAKTKLVKEKTVGKKTADLQNTISMQSEKCVTASSADVELNNKSKKNVTKAKMPVVNTPRRSSRLACKPSKNYKV